MFQSEIITLFSKSSTQWICLHHFLHIPPSLNNIFIREHFQIFGLRWCYSDDFVDLSFVWTLWTHTILHIFPWLPPSSTFWQWHSGHEYDVAASTILFFCLQSSCRHIFRSSKIFFGDIYLLSFWWIAAVRFISLTRDSTEHLMNGSRDEHFANR